MVARMLCVVTTAQHYQGLRVRLVVCSVGVRWSLCGPPRVHLVSLHSLVRAVLKAACVTLVLPPPPPATRALTWEGLALVVWPLPHPRLSPARRYAAAWHTVSRGCVWRARPACCGSSWGVGLHAEGSWVMLCMVGPVGAG
jgi:hypothetical protein